MFAETYCVNLARREDRWKEFLHEYPSELLQQPIRFNAIDGKICHCPVWWKQGGGAWGCYRSHLSIIESCLNRGVESVLIFEDDATFTADFTERFPAIMQDAIKLDWEWLYLGGQFLGEKVHPPKPLSQNIVRPYNVNRTHAFALRGRRMMEEVYRLLTTTDKWKRGQHIDHKFGTLHEKNYREPKFRILCPNRWIVGQRESISNINGRDNETRFWQSTKTRRNLVMPFVFVIGNHSSGSSCLAGCLYHLGLYFGRRESFAGYHGDLRGCEPRDLMRHCEKMLPFPSAQEQLRQQDFQQRMTRFVNTKQREAKRQGKLAAAKYPQLCALLKHVLPVFTMPSEQVRIVHIDRPLDDSIASITRREPKRKPQRLREHCRLLADQKQRLLSECREKEIPICNIQYYDLLSNPGETLNTVCEFLKLKPSVDQIRQAVEFVKPEKRHV